LSPFKLHIFDLVRSYVTQLRAKAIDHQQRNRISIDQVLINLGKAFSVFPDKPIIKITSANLQSLPDVIKLAESPVSEEEVTAKISQIVDSEKASSEDGLKNLQTEHRDLNTLSNLLSELFSAL